MRKRAHAEYSPLKRKPSPLNNILFTLWRPTPQNIPGKREAKASISLIQGEGRMRSTKHSENTNITELQFNVHVWNLLYFLLEVSSILFSFLPLRTYCLYTESPKYWSTQLINTLILISIGSSWSLMFFFALLGENAFYLPPDIRKQCDWFQGDQPVKNGVKFGHKHV